MPFLAKLDLETRQARRLLANRLDGLLIGRDRRFDVIVHNLSETGFLAEFASDLRVGDEVRLRLAGIGFVGARIVWKRGLAHGGAFLVPVSAEIVEDTVGSSVSLDLPQVTGSDGDGGARTVERLGMQKRARRERLATIVIMVCILMAIAVLAAAFVRVVAR